MALLTELEEFVSDHSPHRTQTCDATQCSHAPWEALTKASLEG